MTETSAVFAAEPAASEASVPAQPDNNAIWVAFEEALTPVLEEHGTFWNYSPDQTACQGTVMPAVV